MKKTALIFLIPGLILLCAVSVYAQSRTDVERGTREVDRLGKDVDKFQDLMQPAPKKETIEEPAQQPVKFQGGKKFLLNEVKLIGNESYKAEEFNPFINKYKNKEVTLGDLETLSKEIERDYLRKGVIAAVFIPPQEVKKGVVTLRIVEARFGELKVKDTKYFDKNRIYYYWQIAPGRILRYDNLSKNVQMMNKNPDREVKAILAAGKKPGTTDVILDSKTSFPAHILYTFDNEGSVSTGKSRTGLGLRHNNFLGFDDTLLQGCTFGTSFSGTYTYHSVPISPDGLSLFYGYARSMSSPLKEFTDLNMKSQSRNTTISLKQDLFDKDQYIGELSAGFQASDKVTHSNSGTVNRDELRIFTFSGSYLKRGFGSTTSFSSELAQGVPYFGASPSDNPIASRNAKSTFTTLNLGMQHRRVLPLKMQASFKFKSQIAFNKLTSQQGFSLGGIDSVRGYPSGDFIGDTGVNTISELLLPAVFIPSSWKIPYASNKLKDDITPLIFVDYGYASRRGTLSEGEKKSVSDLGVGTGVRVRVFDQAMLRFEWGWHVANKPLTESGMSRFHFSVDVQEKLPEEVERIRKMMEEEENERLTWKLVNEELSRPNSSAGNMLRKYHIIARKAYQEGDLKKSKKYYQKIDELGRTLYLQAQEYVKACTKQQNDLEGYKKLALQYQKEKNIIEEKKMWEKIVRESSFKPLILEYSK